MFASLGGSLFILPVCYHPVTVISVDDDKGFLKLLTAEVSDKLSLMCFDNPEEALEYTKNKHHYLPFTARCLIEEQDGVKLNFLAIRNEIYNPNRFKEISIVITDYDMPHITGIDLVKTMEFQPEIAQYTHILLTGKISDEFKAKIAKLGINGEYLGKDDPEYINKLFILIEKRLAKIFQWYAYIPARILSRNPQEKTSFLFDGNFMQIFNAHIQENNVCELYLFDKQGSYLFLDEQANLSWLFIRNETGIENTIKLALKYGAPEKVIEAIKTKKVILSLYESEDFEKKKGIIDWDSYLIPATVFETNAKYLSVFPNLIEESNHGEQTHPKYYYAFTKDFPDHGIEKERVLSYQDFLRIGDY